MKGRPTLVPLILILAFFGCAWVFVGPSGPTAFDLWVLQSVSRLRSPAISDVFVFVTELGRTPVALMFSVVAWRRSRRMAFHLAAATLGGWLIGEVVKLLIQRPRPVAILPLIDASAYSFPSGHSLVAAATYTTAAILICREVRLPAHRILVTAVTIIAVALVALSRVYLGVHYASDAIGGILLGTAWAAILAQR